MSALTDRFQAMAPRERAILIVFGVVALLGIVYVVLFRGGGEPEPFQPPTGARPTVKATPTPKATPKASPVTETFEVFDGKDPFRPLTIEPGPTPAPSGSPTPGPDGGPSNGQRVSLLDITTRGGTRYATVEVEGTSYTVKEGDRFATSYRVLDLTASCGTFVFGDERFTLCVGQEVIK